MEYMGIDVSAYDGQIDWSLVGKSGINFAILRSITRDGKPDIRFEDNYEGCRKNDLAKGIYVLSYALTPEEAAAEASSAVNLLAGRELELPVFMDMEWAGQRNLSKSEITNIALSFLYTITNNTSYKAGVYCDLDWYQDALEPDRIPFPFWIARYGSGLPEPEMKPQVLGLAAWQYTSEGRVAGIDGPVDLDLGYEEYFKKNEQPQGAKWIGEPDGRWWYREADGGYPANQWKIINKRWYYFDEQGYMMTGLIQVKEQEYYLCARKGADEGACMKTDESGALSVWTVS